MRAMKDSGVEWIGEIPEDWETQKVKFLFSIKKRIAGREGYTVLSITQKGIVPKNLDSNEGQMAQDYSKYQLVHAGDYAMNHMDLLTGWIDISSYEGVTSPDYRVFVANEPESIACKFYLYFFQCCYANKIFYGMGQGVSGFGRWRLPAEQFLNFRAPYPSLNEQISISSILDTKCAEMDKVVEQTRATIEEYKKLKQAIITEAVTKGVRGPRPMKPSGVEWIGDIPEEWSIMKTLWLLEMPITDGPHETPTLYEEGIPFISAEAVSCGRGGIDFSHKRGYISREYYDECCKKYTPRLHDIYMIKSGATTGRVSMVDTEEIFTIWSPLAVLRAAQRKMRPRFLFYSLQADYYQKQISFSWSFGTQQNIGMRVLEQLKIATPDAEEQQEIVAYLDTKCAEIDRIIGKKEQLIEELGSYKKSLIYEYVTGKKQVLYK